MQIVTQIERFSNITPLLNHPKAFTAIDKERDCKVVLQILKNLPYVNGKPPKVTTRTHIIRTPQRIDKASAFGLMSVKNATIAVFDIPSQSLSETQPFQFGTQQWIELIQDLFTLSDEYLKSMKNLYIMIPQSAFIQNGRAIVIPDVLCYYGVKYANELEILGYTPDAYNTPMQPNQLSDQIYIHYVPPEFLIYGSFDKEKSSVWSIGCLIAEMELGRSFFNGSTPEEVIQSIEQNLGPIPEFEVFNRWNPYKPTEKSSFPHFPKDWQDNHAPAENYDQIDQRISVAADASIINSQSEADGVVLNPVTQEIINQRFEQFNGIFQNRQLQFLVSRMLVANPNERASVTEILEFLRNQ